MNEEPTRNIFSALAVSLFAMACMAGEPAGITVDLKLDETNYISGERVRAVVDVKNMLAERVSVGYLDSEDLLIVELYRASDHMQLERSHKRPFVSAFWVGANEGMKLETFLGDNYDLTYPARYLARPVLIHRGKRYSGEYRSFDVVPGFDITTAVQQFSNAAGKKRFFELKRWMRDGNEHLFLKVRDDGDKPKRWATLDLGPMMRVTAPTVSILSSGEVIVIHRNAPDSFARNEFWSMTDAFVKRSAMMVRDPDTAGRQGVQEVYKKSGGVKAENRPWWKFW
ncbi:MAG: hypothetical protein K6F50_03380 [Kiritimatiellae bacterium]|nr:hypothetical protein [Kiritimatiellia bacterium]